MKILIVDDDRFCRELMNRLLSPYGERHLGADGFEALSAMHKAWDAGEPFDLVCLDVQMPNCNGQDALRSIRQAEAERGIGADASVKVIMTTALDDMENLASAFSRGCQSYVCKPIDEAALVSELRNMDFFPAENLASSEADTQEAQGDATTPAPSSSANLRILIIDDDMLCRELLRRILGLYGTCDVAQDGHEGVAAFHAALENDQQYDMVCLDIMMPDVDGHEVLQKIRKLEEQQGIFGHAGSKVIMTTALRDPKHCLQAFREGCECYYTKPIKEDELVLQMQKLGLLEPQPA